MRRGVWTTVLGMVLVAGQLAGCLGGDDDSSSDDGGGDAHAAILSKARTVARALDTPGEALAAGYEPDPYCIPGMGVHWLKTSALDTEIDPDEPEVVLFVPGSSDVTDVDAMTFAGIEYVVVTQGTEHNTTETVPSFYGQKLVGPMPGHFPGMPWHAELHVFLAEGATSGPGFAETHENVVCPIGTTPGDADILAAARAVAPSVDTPAEALAAGYRPTTVCVPHMGVHWIKESAFDTELDPAEPEVVMFLPNDANIYGVQDDIFLGVEYVAVTQGTEHNTTETVWRLFDRPLDGPMPGHEPGMPWHAEVHVWLGEYGRTDPFNHENRLIVCPDGIVPEMPSMAHAPLASAVPDGPGGMAVFIEGRIGEVVVVGGFGGVPPGAHAVHVHEVGTCDPAAPPTGGGPVGAFGAGPHIEGGELGTVEVGDDTAGALSFVVPLTLDPTSGSTLVGRSIIVHALGESGPDGDAGPAVLCGVITAGPPPE